MVSSIIQRRTALFLLVGVGGACSMVPSARAEASSARSAKPSPDLSAGRAAYERACARCHGLTGLGDGLDAKRLYPRPRNLTEGVFKFRSTASGTAPTDEDLFQTITNGLPGTGMPDWSQLDENLRWQLVDYVKSLSTVSQDAPPQPVELGVDPGPTHADPAKGRAAYDKLGCAACHGPEGRGNGPSTRTLVDNWGRAIRAKDLTEGWNYRGGNTPKAIVQRVLTGLDGTPMPSYAEAVSTEDAWQLAYYVRSLQQEIRSTGLSHAAYLDGPLPVEVNDPRWDRTARADLRLRNVVDPQGQIEHPLTVTRVSLQALHNGQSIAFRFSWHDASEDRPEAAGSGAEASAEGTPPDRLALVLRPVGIAGDVVTLYAWPLRDSPKLDLCVWTPEAASGRAREAVVDRYEPLLDGAVPSAGRESQARYDDGLWTVLITRPLAPADLPPAAQLAPSQIVPVAVVAWDGSNAGQRAVSMWVDVLLEPPATARQAGPAAQAPRRRVSPMMQVIAAIVLLAGIGLAIKPR